MWMVEPKILCRKHLLGAHVELHMFLGTLRKKKKIDGYLKNNCLEPRKIYQEHYDIVQEMLKRGYNHNTPITEEDCFCISYLTQEQQYWQIDKHASLYDLTQRCGICRNNYFQSVF